jgi:Rieske Fe-S protein
MERSSDETSASSRRTVIAGVGVGAVGALAALAGCGTAANNASGDSGSMPTSDANSPTGASSSAAQDNGAANAGGTELGKTTDVPVGGGKVYDAAKVVVTQPKAGTYKAFTAVCTHQGCTVNKVASGVISCPCHGSKFSAEDGSVKGGPAPAPLAAKTVAVRGGSIFLT